MDLNALIIELKDFIPEIEKISFIKQDLYSGWRRFYFEVFYYGNFRPSTYCHTDYIKKYEDSYRQIRIPIKIFGIMLWHKKKIIKERIQLLTDEQIERKKEEDYIKLKTIRNKILSFFDEDIRQIIDQNCTPKTSSSKYKTATNFQKYGICSPAKHAWGLWTRYSGHRQRKCYKCKEIEAEGFVDGQPVTQVYAESLFC